MSRLLLHLSVVFCISQYHEDVGVKSEATAASSSRDGNGGKDEAGEDSYIRFLVLSSYVFRIRFIRVVLRVCFLSLVS